jgi:hypothetical protein
VHVFAHEAMRCDRMAKAASPAKAGREEPMIVQRPPSSANAAAWRAQGSPRASIA